MPNDLSLPERAGAALLTYIEQQTGVADIGFAQPPQRLARGLRTDIYAFRLHGQGLDGAWAGPLVLRLLSEAQRGEQIQREAAIQRFVVERGYAAPRLLAAEPTGEALGRPFVVMERAPGVAMSRRLAGRNLITVYRLAGAFADAHVALHRLPVEGWPMPSEGFSVDRQLTYYRSWMDREPELGEAFAWLEAHRGAVIPEERSVCHNNFHPTNAIVGNDGRVIVIDWSTSDLGDRHGDIAGTLVLMQTVPLTERSVTQRLISRVGRHLFPWRYLRRYQQQLPVEADRLRYWEALYALAAWGVFGAFEVEATESQGARSNKTARTIATQRANLHRYFWRRIKEHRTSR